MTRLVLAALAVTFAATPALAQSKKYPPVATDPDVVEERHSNLWDGALHPDLKPYRDLVRDAKRMLERGTAEDTKAALDKLDAATKRVQTEPDAFVLRGGIYLQKKQWAECADDLAAAEATNKLVDERRTRMRIDLGLCYARAGKAGDAERILVAAAASSQTHKGELYMRLGETRIALGKLDEAIDALEAALDQGDSNNDLTRWLLALAYDRARRPNDALESAQDAKRFDQSMSQITSPRQPLLGQGDTEYMQGLAYLYALPRPEYALLYFRRFLDVAPDSAWRRRAEEHVREIAAMKLPARDTLTASGTASIGLDEIKVSLERPMPSLRQCVAKFPFSAFQVLITKVGPRTSEAARDRPIYRVPPPELKASNALNVDARSTTDPAFTEVYRCLEKEAARLPLPAPRERDTHYRLTFIVVAP
ncbi:MAG: tetratricopeptide repeat protein [Kofleriaceae bacterium]|nr:tetratricopeptide repeat protein [Kofleriaceae bacterium]